MDEKGRALQGRVDFSERNTKTLETGIKHLLKKHHDGYEAMMDLSHKIRDTAAQEQFVDLQEDLIAIAECIKYLGETQCMIMCEDVEDKVMSTIKYIQDRILHPIKLLLKDRERAQHKCEAVERKVGPLHSDRPPERTFLGLLGGRGDSEDDALKQQRVYNYRQCVKNTDEIVDANFRCFEKNRVVELKIMLEELLRAEMLYHCRAIEILEPLCVTMRQLDPDRAMDSITRELEELNTKAQRQAAERRRFRDMA